MGTESLIRLALVVTVAYLIVYFLSKACNIAATKALREADIIVSTSTGAMDPRLLSACGISTESDEDIDASGRVQNTEGGSLLMRQKAQNDRLNTAPDGL